jgi:hypothetical protein
MNASLPITLETSPTPIFPIIILGDGSAQQTTGAGFRQNLQPFFDPTTNWPAGHVPSSPSIRVLFP